MRALVTGGGGFVGLAVVRALVGRGDHVRTLARGEYPEVLALGGEHVRGDVGDRDVVLRAVDGVDVVFHVAAKAGVWGRREDFVRANVEGTRNVVDACRVHGVERLVFTSSPSVVFAGLDQEGIDESAPYPSKFLADYPATKAEAEKLVLAASGPRLATVALRPHLVWGPGDNHIVPRLVARARAQKLRKIGDGHWKVDTTYIDNAADAHLSAADALAPGAPCSGRAYFVSNGEPVPIGEMIDRIVAAAGAPAVTRSVSPAVAYAAGALTELVYRALGRVDEPLITRFVASELSTSHWFDLSAIRRDLGWTPRVSLAEGMARLAASFSKSFPS